MGTLTDCNGIEIRIGDEMAFGGYAESIGKVTGIGDDCFFTEDDNGEILKWESPSNADSLLQHFHPTGDARLFEAVRRFLEDYDEKYHHKLNISDDTDGINTLCLIAECIMTGKRYDDAYDIYAEWGLDAAFDGE